MTFLGCSKRQKYAKLELFSKSRIHDHTFQNGVKSSLASVNILVRHETKLNRIYFHCGTSQRLYMLVSTVAFQGWHIGYGICPGIPLIWKHLQAVSQNSRHSDTVGEMLTCGRFKADLKSSHPGLEPVSLPLESGLAFWLAWSDRCSPGVLWVPGSSSLKSGSFTFALLGLCPETCMWGSWSSLQEDERPVEESLDAPINRQC